MDIWHTVRVVFHLKIAFELPIYTLWSVFLWKSSLFQWEFTWWTTPVLPMSHLEEYMNWLNSFQWVIKLNGSYAHLIDMYSAVFCIYLGRHFRNLIFFLDFYSAFQWKMKSSHGVGASDSKWQKYFIAESQNRIVPFQPDSCMLKNLIWYGSVLFVKANWFKTIPSTEFNRIFFSEEQTKFNLRFGSHWFSEMQILFTLWIKTKADINVQLPAFEAIEKRRFSYGFSITQCFGITKNSFT